MMRAFALGFLMLFAAASLPAASPAEEVSAAIKKLKDQGNYAWTTTVESSGTTTNPPRRTVTEGKVAKDGTIYLAIPRYTQKMESLTRGKKTAYKVLGEWQGLNLEPEGGGATNRFRLGGRSRFSAPPPDAEAAELLAKAANLKREGADFVGELSPADAYEVAMMGVRIRTATIAEDQTKGRLRFTVKDGMLAGYECHVTAAFTVGGSPRKVDRTVRVVISDVGKASFEIPPEAAKFL